MKKFREIKVGYSLEGKLCWPIGRRYEKITEEEIDFIERSAFDELMGIIDYIETSLKVKTGCQMLLTEKKKVGIVLQRIKEFKQKLGGGE